MGYASLLSLCLLASAITTSFAASDPLCPGNYGDDDVHINCKIERGSFIPSQGEPLPSNPVVMGYNIDRNGNGGDGSREAGLKPIIDLLSSSDVPTPDILFLSEVSRGCSRDGHVSGAEEVARSLGMAWTYAVEYVTIGDTNSTSECSIGNAVLSRYDILEADQLRFADQCCRYGGRHGGRIVATATVEINSHPVHLYAAHFESGKSDVGSVVKSLKVRELQATETASDALEKSKSSGGVAIVGGDFNAPLLNLDPTVRAFTHHDFQDAHSGLPQWKRVTCPDSELQKYHLDTLDYVMVHGAMTSGAEVCMKEECKGWSDHVPLWATVEL